MEFLEVAVVEEILKFIAPLWIALVVGVLVGWVWRPNWIPNNGHRAANDTPRDENTTNYESLLSFVSYVPSLNSIKLPLPSWISDDRGDFSGPSSVTSDCSASTVKVNSSEKSNVVNNDDLDHLCRIVEEKDGGPAWIQMMDRSMPTMDYQAWRRDPESGPPQYRSRTVFQNAVPEIVRDFFWDDEFRAKWDDMLLHSSTLEECAVTGTMQVQWIRKFPFFCSDREYIIGRRIWESGRSYYCVTKGVPCETVPRRNKPRRVDLYYSSWLIRAVESKNGDGLTACEVLLFHHEDMGIPWEIAKLGVRQGMWGAVKKIEPGLRAYQKFRTSGAPISRSVSMAQINTKVSADYLSSLESSTSNSIEGETAEPSEKPVARNIPKMLVLGGAVVLACSIDRGLLTKAIIFGVARRFANMGKRL